MSGFDTHVLDTAFGHPRGILGRLGGVLMARTNAATELQVVELARLSGDERVAVIGPGPGVGLLAAGERAAWAVGVEPSERMRRSAAQRCASLVAAGKVELRDATAEDTSLPDVSCDVVLSVNNAQLWPDRAIALAELHRVLRPGGLLLVSTHERWLPGGRAGLSRDAREAGFDEVQTWAWEPPGRAAPPQAQLRARRATV
ncbi:class I SAM-dependent methyltransferase [Saccharopolyspora erythraea]|uniref:class I SAM-dependent methyltransferase n=1 Tax=Saccharopolyspora erythraea TaxID=1836 RepID=UPI001BAB5B74|nr:class I SAM-dependent methyltransferase [Saccharopolyspora erythraea]QUH01040.1 class I SAM-dependent methyltransferase [Saccharopolyspora erythraea]